MSACKSPTVPRRRLGYELRQLRNETELTMEEVAVHVGCSDSKISRIENAKGPIRRRDVETMLDLYGVTDEQRREPVLRLVKEAGQQAWWTDYEDILPSRFESYIGMEAEAASVRAYDTQVINGLLQTEKYAEAIIREGRGSREDELERLLDLRMRRQERIHEEDPLHLWCILDEAALHRPIGGRKRMREQLEHLLKMGDRPNVTLQVLPYSKGAHAGLGGPFSIIEFPHPDHADVAYVDSPAGNVYQEKRKQLRWFARVFDHLRATALDPNESAVFIDTVTTQEMT